MIRPLSVTPYCGFKLHDKAFLTEVKFDKVEKDGVLHRAKVIQPLKPADFGKIRADDFSIRVIKDAGMLDTLQECATIKLSPLDAQETVIDAVTALNDAEFAQKYRLETLQQNVQQSEPQSEPQEK